MTCKDCLHYEACKSILEAMGYTVDGDGENADKRCDTFADRSRYVVREKGEWDIKHRHHGGFRRYTGYDDFGEKHTITVDERSECEEPYCPKCGKWNESVWRNFCPNCGADMRKGENG